MQLRRWSSNAVSPGCRQQDFRGAGRRQCQFPCQNTTKPPVPDDSRCRVPTIAESAMALSQGFVLMRKGSAVTYIIALPCVDLKDRACR